MYLNDFCWSRRARGKSRTRRGLFRCIAECRHGHFHMLEELNRSLSNDYCKVQLLTSVRSFIFSHWNSCMPVDKGWLRSDPLVRHASFCAWGKRGRSSPERLRFNGQIERIIFRFADGHLVGHCATASINIAMTSNQVSDRQIMCKV